MKTGTIAVAVALTCLATTTLFLLVGWTHNEKMPKRSSTPAPTPRNVPLEHEFDHRPIRADILARSSPPSAPIPSALPTPEHDVPADVSAPEPPTPQDQIAYADTVFSQETTDVNWARETERTVLGLFEATAANAVFEIVECRTTLCKVQSKHTSAQQFDAFNMGLVGAMRGWRGAFYSVSEPPGADGNVRNTLMLAKEGHNMPTLQQ